MVARITFAAVILLELWFAIGLFWGKNPHQVFLHLSALPKHWAAALDIGPWRTPTIADVQGLIVLVIMILLGFLIAHVIASLAGRVAAGL